MTAGEHFFYWILPLLVLLILVIFYFSQVPFLMELVSPQTNWEWGILENLQLVVILGIFSFSTLSIFKADDLILKIGFGLISIFSVFVFLEEMDYGAHFVQLLSGVQESYLNKYTGVYNLHNQGNNAKLFKRPVYLVIALLFMVVPYTRLFKDNKYFRFVVPQPRMVIIVAILVLADLLPRFIVFFNIRPDGGLGTNIGEFSELIMYYLFFLYVRSLFIKASLPSALPIESR